MRPVAFITARLLGRPRAEQSPNPSPPFIEGDVASQRKQDGGVKLHFISVKV